MNNYLRAAFAALVVAIMFLTLGPLGLRPHFFWAPLERLAAYMLLGSVATLAFPRSIWRIINAVILLSIGLELLQLIDPTRDARVRDVIPKVAGGTIGASVTFFAARLFSTLRPRTDYI